MFPVSFPFLNDWGIVSKRSFITSNATLSSYWIPISLPCTGDVGDWRSWFSDKDNDRFDKEYARQMKDHRMSFRYCIWRMSFHLTPGHTIWPYLTSLILMWKKTSWILFRSRSFICLVKELLKFYLTENRVWGYVWPLKTPQSVT